MPIVFETIEHLPTCIGSRWTIIDEDRLAAIVAWVAMGRSRHALKVIHEQQATDPSVQDVAAEAIKNLSHVPSDAVRYHRDGWVFQIISWVAMHVQGGPAVKGAYPHMIRAQKGIDGLYLELSASNDAIERVLICEEKASQNPANILGDVWRGIAEVESGAKDAQLTDGITQILERYPVQNLEAMVESVHWKDKKAYRVAITTLPAHQDLEKRRGLFSNYSTAAPGADSARRRAETLMLEDIRGWMGNFCARAVAYINERLEDV